jgi:uncharacterized protein (DUF1697 family)
MKTAVLLRGVNVGGNRKMPMANLTSWLEAAGFTSVETYIQSGNVVLGHDARCDVKKLVRDTIAEHTGWDVRVLVRSVAEMRSVVAANPYPGAESTQLHVSFLDEAPDEAALALNRSDEWLPEEYTVISREVYLHLPDGMGRSVMVPRLKLIKDATTRNWNTVLAMKKLVVSS